MAAVSALRIGSRARLPVGGVTSVGPVQHPLVRLPMPVPLTDGALVACFAGRRRRTEPSPAAALAWLLAGAAGWSVDSSAGAAVATDAPLAEFVVTVRALPGPTSTLDRSPGSVETLTEADLRRRGSASLTAALADGLASVNINDNLDDEFQPDILYRGFAASPVLGTPQGLAVYQSGVRINEAFGDVVNWDLVPDVAIRRVDVVSANPVYGLNALGGAIGVSMKDGFSLDGASGEVSAGSFGRHQAVAELGHALGDFGLYLAATVVDSSGWRRLSGDSVHQGYAALSARGAHLSADLSYTYAANTLSGQGAAPVQELAVNRSLVFTGPQSTQDHLDFVVLNAGYHDGDAGSAQGTIYYRRYRQLIANGNTTSYTSCAAAANAGLLCQGDGLTAVIGASGAPLPDLTVAGSTPIGANDSEAIASNTTGGELELTLAEPLLGHRNNFEIGASADFARVTFGSSVQPGAINASLQVIPSGLVVDTPEGSQFAATPVILRAMNAYYGAYLTDTLDLTPVLSLTASGRYDVVDLELRDLRGSNLTGDSRYTHLNPAVGATLRWTPSVTAYVNLAETTRAPTASEIECSDPTRPCLLPSSLAGDPPTLRQVVGHSVELGLRGVPDAAMTRGLTWSAGLFRTVLHDDIYAVASSVSSGYFQNIGATRRQGLEAAAKYRDGRWSGSLSYSYVDATFESALTLGSPSNPLADAAGNINVRAGDRLPGIPRHRARLGVDYRIVPRWTIGLSLDVASNQYYRGDEANLCAPLPGYHVVGLRSVWNATADVEMFVSATNLLNARYATFGIFGDPAGVGAPGVPSGAAGSAGAIDNRFQSPAAPFGAFAGVRVRF